MGQRTGDWSDRQLQTFTLHTLIPSSTYSQLPHEDEHMQQTDEPSSDANQNPIGENSFGKTPTVCHTENERPSQHNESTNGFLKRLNSLLSGWRQAVVACAAVAALILVINIILTLLGLFRYGTFHGVGTVYFGDCDTVKRWDIVIHLVINILSTCLLGASSYTMQCLSSPTRSEVDVAHGKRKSLMIGILSLKNLLHVRKSKAWLWAGLALSTLPLHLLWNSAVFSTLGAHEYTYVIVDDSFLNGASFQEPDTRSCIESNRVPSLASFYNAFRAGNYSERMSSYDCIDAYGSGFLTTRRNMIAVTQPNPNMFMVPECAYGTSQKYQNGSSVLAFSYQGTNTRGFHSIVSDFNHGDSGWAWLCAGFGGHYNISNDSDDFYYSCKPELAQSLTKDNGSWYLSPYRETDPMRGFSSQSYPIKYCYSEEKIPQTCQLQFVSYIMFAVIVCNIVKVICMAIAANLLRNPDEPIFTTIGDAVSSYIERPDTTTQGWCLLDGLLLKDWQAKRLSVEKRDAIRTYTRPARRFLMAATSKTRYICTVSLCTIYSFAGAGIMIPALFYFNASDPWKIGLGTLDPSALWSDNIGSGGESLITAALLANVFQLITSAFYLLYSSLLTAQCGALEWSSYANHHGKRKALRVSWPKGQQRSTYYLQLPYKYGLPLLAAQMALHFFISQSAFLVRVQWYKYDSSIDPDALLTAIGYSSIGMLVTSCVAGAMTITLLLHSFRPLSNLIPIHRNSTAVISAMCHLNDADSNLLAAVQESNKDAALSPVMWGAVVESGSNDEIGHCSFTCDVVQQPVYGRKYR